VIHAELVAALRDALSRGGDLLAIVVEYKDRGLTQAQAYAALEQLRRSAEDSDDEATENRIMDAMDIVVGWCSPAARLWPDYYKP
jgi:hypothetical protein